MSMTEMIPRNMERLLAELGLEKRRSAAHYILPALGVFAAGALVGGLLGLLLAPSSGRELRREIGRKLHHQTGDREREREPARDNDRSAKA